MKAFSIITGCLLSVLLLRGQPCPPRDSLWKRLIYLRDSSTLSVDEKLKELSRHEKAIKNCSYRNDSTHALLLQRIGAMYFYQGDFLKASRYMQASIDITLVNTGKSSVNPAHNIRNYYNLAWIYDSLDNVTGKMKALDSCAAIAVRLKSADLYCIRALHTRVEHSFDIGDYSRCINYATICERVSREYAKSGSENEYMVGLQFALTSLFWKVNALIQFDKYEMAEGLLTDKIQECKKAGLFGHLAYIYQVMAEIQLENKNPQKALSNYKLALQYVRQAGDDVGSKVIVNNIGYKVYFRQLNNPEKALAYCKSSLTYINKKKSDNLADAFETLNVLGYIANIYVQKGTYDSAFKYFKLALDQIKPGINENYLLQISDEEFLKQKQMHYLTELLIDKGDALKQQYIVTKESNSLNQAIQIYKVADQLLDRVKFHQTELQSKLLWRSNTRRLFEHAIEACYLQGSIKDGFYFFEKSRAVLLNDQLIEQRWMGEADIRMQTQLKKRILRLEREMSNDIASDEYQSAQKIEIFSAKQELDRLGQLIKERNPFYYQSFLDTGLITIQYVQQNLLKDHHALLEIFSGDSAVYVLLITPNKNYLTRINKKDYETNSNKYISYLSDANLMNRQFDDFVQTSINFYNLLFQNTVLPSGRIIISPDGQYFPFESLITSAINQPLNYFLNDHAVSYTYSARFLGNHFSTGSATGKDFMGVAPVNYPSAFSLVALPWSDRSLYTISRYFNNAVNQLDTDATRNNFLQQFSQYRIIQLYTHAADSSSNNEPVIYFADSVLYLSDLINDTKPVTSLIVLSACETGTGKVYNGEGVFSFNRGFAALGIPAAITNLWSVDNTSTYLLTELFYKWLAKGSSTDVALQKAKLEFLQIGSKEKSMPYYWAGPVLVGKTDTIKLSKPHPWKWIVLLVCIGGAIFLALRKWSTLKKMV